EPVGELAVSSMHQSDTQGWRIEQGEVALEIGLSPFSLSLFKGEDCLVHTADSALACGQLDDEPVWRLELSLDENDSIYGLGETLGDLDRRGENIVSDLAN